MILLPNMVCIYGESTGKHEGGNTRNKGKSE